MTESQKVGALLMMLAASLSLEIIGLQEEPVPLEKLLRGGAVPHAARFDMRPHRIG